MLLTLLWYLANQFQETEQDEVIVLSKITLMDTLTNKLCGNKIARFS